MIQLKARGVPVNIFHATLAIVTGKEKGQGTTAYASQENGDILLTTDISRNVSQRMVANIPSLDHLEDGDIIYITTNGTINTLFRASSPHNSLFITDRCNSNCLMCSQPPRNSDDLDHFFKINSELIS